MKIRWWLPPWCHTDTSESEAALAEVQSRDEEITALGAELEVARKANHFSRSVNEAISRQRGRTT